MPAKRKTSKPRRPATARKPAAKPAAKRVAKPAAKPATRRARASRPPTDRERIEQLTAEIDRKSVV